MLLYLIVSLGSLITATNGYFLGCASRPCEHFCVNLKDEHLGYHCLCRSGYIVNPSDKRKCLLLRPVCDRGFKNSDKPPHICVDIDECSSGKSPCEQNCRNSDGSYQCSCRSGFVVSTRDRTKCERPGVTNCPQGFQPSPTNSANCIDIDECADNPPCQQLCNNNKGSYTCNCRSGYQINEKDPSKCDIINNCESGYTPNSLDPTDCLDVDECSKSPCEDTCTNTKGSFKCSCRNGFAVDPNNTNNCTDVDECSKSPCEHTCTNTKGSFKCSCRNGFAVDPNNTNNCTEVDICKTKADVILVFDASDSIGVEHFDKQFVFAERLISDFELGPSGVRFGGIVFSKESKKLFDLKDHSTIETLHKALSNVPYMSSSTYTHGAFKLIDKQQLFSTANGGREDAPDIVVLFTDGNPSSVNKALESAQVLKDSGVLILGVGIGADLALPVLMRITSTPSDVVEATSYDTLDYIEKRLTQLLCQASKSSRRIV